MNTNGTVIWRRTGKDVTLHHCPDHEQIGLWYARLYTSRAGYQYSETNQLIFNLKKDPRVNAGELSYKTSAINRFADEVAQAFRKNPVGTPIFLVPVPSSKCAGHPEYDDRLLRVVKRVADSVPRAIYCPVLVRARDVPQAHTDEAERDPATTYNSVRVELDRCSALVSGEGVLIIDDVISSGATFTACRQRLLEALPNSTIRGLFWAKSEYRAV